MKTVRLGYKFRSPDLLKTALTHPSHRNEKGTGVDNQRLEFLGDAVIGCVAAQILHECFPDAAEGELAKKKSAVVSGQNLAGCARSFSLGEFMLFGKGEEKTGPDRDSILADAFEAVAGAIFLDGGYRAAYDFVSALILKSGADWQETADYKSELQTVFHRKFGSLPVYQTEETGPGHQRYFFCEAGNGSEIFGRGQGASKKQAEQRAAKEALEKFE